MDNFYPTKHFINNNLTTLGERQLRRNVSKAYNQGESTFERQRMQEVMING